MLYLIFILVCVLLFSNVTLLLDHSSVNRIDKRVLFILAQNSMLSQDKTDDWTDSIHFHSKLPVIIQPDG